MNEEILLFDEGFPQLLEAEAQGIVNLPLKIGEKFKSADSFSYLLTSGSQKYVGKIFRFKDWPPEGKLELIEKLLHRSGVLHEEIIYITHQHPIFKFGWQLSNFIPGGTVKDLLDTQILQEADYYQKLGKLLNKVHQTKFDYYGSILNPQVR